MSQRPPVVLITGTSSGIGRAIAGAFAAKGFEVFGTSRNPQRNEPIAGVELLPLDVSESSIAQAQELFDTNFFGLIRVTSEVLPYLRAQGSGRIVNISSVLGFLPAPYGALYAASKHAVEGYSESLDHETREFGVRVSVVEPGYTATAFDANAADPDSPIESYRALREHVKEGLMKAVRAGDDPSVVAKVALKAANSRTPKLRYPAGPLGRQLTVLKKFAPEGLLDKGIRKANNLTKAPKPKKVPQNVK